MLGLIIKGSKKKMVSPNLGSSSLQHCFIRSPYDTVRGGWSQCFSDGVRPFINNSLIFREKIVEFEINPVVVYFRNII